MEVHVRDVADGKFCIGGGNDAVEKDFDEFETGCFRCCFARIIEAIAAAGNAGSVRFGLLRSDVDGVSGIRYLFVLAGGDILLGRGGGDGDVVVGGFWML